MADSCAESDASASSASAGVETTPVATGGARRDGEPARSGDESVHGYAGGAKRAAKDAERAATRDIRCTGECARVTARTDDPGVGAPRRPAGSMDAVAGANRGRPGSEELCVRDTPPCSEALEADTAETSTGSARARKRGAVAESRGLPRAA